MKYQPRDIDRLAKDLLEEINDLIENSGLFFRIFYRCKTRESLSRKLTSSNKYDGENKFLRDIIGIRINLYFIDDLELVTEFFKSKLSILFVEETIDKNTTTEFKPTRTNIIFRIPEKYQKEFREVIRDKRIDSTFELQLRTVLSEGWHEVDHDLRYKCQNDWNSYPEYSRMFNGFLAALETQEWSMVQLFERIAFEHYKVSNINALIRMKLRLRFDSLQISPGLLEKINSSFSRALFKLDRNEIIVLLLNNKVSFPLTIDNVIFLLNYSFIMDKEISNFTPKVILEFLEESKSVNPSKIKMSYEKSSTGMV